MLTEISLNILDTAENSVRAGAQLLRIDVTVNEKEDRLTVVLEDNGCGMTAEQVQSVEDPFYTTRTTRKVGLGVPFFKQAAELTGGSFQIQSELGKGTRLEAVFVLSSIDRMPLGDITTTIHTLVVYHPEMDFIYRYCFNDKEFVLDTREFREVLGGIPFQTPEVSGYIKEYLQEHKNSVDGGKEI